MAQDNEAEVERVFTVELNSGADLKKVSIPNGSQRILMEGTIGSLKRVGFIEDRIFEIVGTAGVLRIDMSEEDLLKLQAIP